MYNSHEELYKFYDEHVRLSEGDRKELRELREKNLGRLNAGMAKLREEGKLKSPSYIDTYNQGSYAMRTLNQHPEFDYDIDVGVLYDANEIPETAEAARKRVEEAMVKSAGDTFSEPPKARQNAVTVKYQKGYHVDFAVYRVRMENREEVIEHAGDAGWKVRNPMEVNNWFNEKVVERSPAGDGVAVMEKQLRRIVCLVKAFAKSRKSWNLPGGMIITTLVEENYVPDNDRDDISLRLTMKKILSRLRVDTTVLSPIDPSGAALTARSKFATRVSNMRDKLEERLPDLDALDDEGCEEVAAGKAWKKFFRHDYWDDSFQKAVGLLPTTIHGIEVGDFSHAQPPIWRGGQAFDVSVKIIGFNTHHGKEVQIESGTKCHAEPGMTNVRFKAVVEGVDEPYEIWWQVVNTGGHASSKKQLRGGLFRSTEKEERASNDQHSTHESLEFHGVHWIECFVVKNGRRVARSGKFIVPIFNRRWGSFGGLIR